MTYVIKVNKPEQLVDFGFKKYGNAFYYNYGRGDTGMEIIVRNEDLMIQTGRMKAPKKVLSLFKTLYKHELIRFENATDDVNIGNVILVDNIKKEIEK